MSVTVCTCVVPGIAGFQFQSFPTAASIVTQARVPGSEQQCGGSAAGVGGSLVARSLIQGADEEIIAPAATDVLQDFLSKSTPKLVTKKGCFHYLFHLNQGPNGQTRPRLLEARDSSTSKSQHQGYGSCLPALGSASTGLNCPPRSSRAGQSHCGVLGSPVLQTMISTHPLALTQPFFVSLDTHDCVGNT